jgi:hypothetical protein
MKRPLKPGVFGHAQFLGRRATVEGGELVPIARLRLDRWWDSTLTLGPNGRPADDRYRPLVVIGINPSDAGATEDDNTSAKCTTFAKRDDIAALGANGLVMVNLHPGISTDPDELCNVLLPYGCDDEHWDAVDGALCENAVAIIVGCGKPPQGLASYRDRVAKLKRIASDIGVGLMCFGTNKDGSPKHPLYLPGNTPIVPWWSGR